ncbi:SAM-dependent methyltransferase [Brachybacterium tyrofermentans]|uniref:SAM-dependent methyltransferase n=1 Tax=Brachybacterium tyrofermentans TaxID=47848 RepID=UPI003F8E26B6
MGIPRRFTIAESSHRILDPFTEERIRTLGDAIGLSPGATVLDLACGKGEWLCLWALDHGILGTGVDINPPFVEAARERAAELGLADRVDILEADASGWVSKDPVDIAACCGATWIGGGVLGTLDRLDLSLRPGGIALIGEPYWREIPPTPEAVRGCQVESVEACTTLDELIESVQGHGWDVVEMVLADEHSWDRYVAAQWLNIRRFCDENPEDELVPELRAELDVAPVQYARYQRRYLGWGVLALQKR